MKRTFSSPLRAFALLLPLLVGCGSIISGTSQSVAITATPAGAEILIYRQHGAMVFQGKAPAVAKLRRKDEYVVTVRVPGYQDAKLNLNGEFNGWSLLNILLLPPIGTLIAGGYDLISGGFWRLDPDEIMIALVPSAPPGPAAPPALSVVVYRRDGERLEAWKSVPLVPN